MSVDTRPEHRLIDLIPVTDERGIFVAVCACGESNRVTPDLAYLWMRRHREEEESGFVA